MRCGIVDGHTVNQEGYVLATSSQADVLDGHNEASQPSASMVVESGITHTRINTGPVTADEKTEGNGAKRSRMEE